MLERLSCALRWGGVSDTKIRRKQVAVILDSPRRRCDFMWTLRELLNAISFSGVQKRRPWYTHLARSQNCENASFL